MNPTAEVLEAVQRGLMRGAKMALDPSPCRLRELSQEAQATDFTREAWISVGESFRYVLDSPECHSLQARQSKASSRE